RGLTPELALDVAVQLTAHDALEAHARDELGITDLSKARPIQAALTSAATFTAGGSLPVLAVIYAPLGSLIWITTVISILVLGVLGLLSAKAGGAPVVRAIARVTLWGAAAMGATAIVGRIFNTVVG
ncbi:MAG TPA: VIT family protein, partial [Rhodobacteraceae bacterium]|nr:VIT family protein [Paracoccaceae bacterium]